MWGLGFLLVIMLYLAAPILIWKYWKGLSRYIGVALLIGIPFFGIFHFYLLPSYIKFKSLCDSSNRYVVNFIEVDYVPPFSGCKMGFDVMISKNYKGFECESYQGKAKEYPRSFSLYRFLPNEQWNSSDCKHGCFKVQPYAWEETCLDVCFIKIPITSTSGELDFRSSNSNGPFTRIRSKISYVVNKENEIVARAINYKYYLFGNDFAKILGGSSGDAPTLSCEHEYDIFELDFLPEKNKPTF
jgi:hypothetical protein